MKKILIACLIAAVICCLLSACVGALPTVKQSADAATETRPRNTDAPARTTAAPEPIPETEPVTTEEPEPEPDWVLDGLTVKAMTDFHNGFAWIQTDSFTALVDRDGFERFRLQDDIVFASDVDEQGTAFVVMRSGSAYREAIYDVSGALRYATSSSDTSVSSSEEHILAQGEGEYLTMRRFSSLTSDGWTFGTLDADGNVLVEFKTITMMLSKSINYSRDLGANCLPNWSKSKGLPLSQKSVSYNGFLDSFNPLPFYVGDGIYYLPGEYALVVPEKGVACSLGWGGGRAIGRAQDGIVLAYHSGTGAYMAWDPVKDESQSLSVERTSFDAPDLMMLSGLSEGKFFSGRSYYNLQGSMVLTITEYPELAFSCGEFSDGWAVMTIRGADKKTYVTVIDDKGNTQFEPFQATAVSMNTRDGYFTAYTDTGWGIYDHDGNMVRSLPDPSAGNIFTVSWFSEGFYRICHDGVQTLYAVPEKES